MHLLRRDEFPSASRNTPAAPAELPVPTPPEGGWSAWYLTDEDDMGESTEQGFIVRLLLAAVTELARERGWARSLVASDQFFAWVEDEPLVRVSPDIYLLDDPPHPYPDSWQTWRARHSPPRFALEVVSRDRKKDYELAPPKYDQLGARELVIFDPDAVTRPRARRKPLQVYRRDDTGWHLVAAGPGPVHSAELDAWLVVVPGPRLRVARDPAGKDLVQIPEEQVAELRQLVAAQAATIEAQAATIAAQAATIAAQAATITAQAATITALETRVASLEAHIVSLEAHIASLEGVVTRLLDRPT